MLRTGNPRRRRRMGEDEDEEGGEEGKQGAERKVVAVEGAVGDACPSYVQRYRW